LRRLVLGCSERPRTLPPSHGRQQDILDLAGDLINRLSELRDRLKRAVLAPTRHIRHRLPIHGETDRRGHNQRDRVDHHLRSSVISDPERVRALVDQRAQLRVCRHVDIDDDPLRLGVTPPAGRSLAQQRV